MANIVKIPLLPFIREFKKDSYAYLSKIIEDNGDVFTLELFLIGKIHFLLAPIYMKYILFDERINYIKAPLLLKSTNDIVGENGLFTTENYAIWRRERDLLKPIFNEKKIPVFASIMTQTTASFLEEWEEYAQNQKPMNIQSSITSITLTVILKILFGNATCDYKYVTRLLKEANSTKGKIFDILIGSPKSNYQYHRTKKKLEDLADDLINQALASTEEDENNMIKLLTETYKKQNASEDEIRIRLRAETITLLSAGHDTTSSALVWIFCYLSLFPIHSDRIQAEVRQAIGNRHPTFQDLQKLPYTQAVIKETLRLQPSVSLSIRQAVKDDLIGQFKINKGDLVLFSPYLMHRIAKYWQNPEGFNPERFLKPLDDSYKFIYLPFSAGPRGCLGEHFAMMEMTFIVAMVAQRYNLFLTSSSVLTRDESIMHRLNDQVTMTVHKLDCTDIGV